MQTNVLSKDGKKKAIIFETVIGFETTIYLLINKKWVASNSNVFVTFEAASEFVKKKLYGKS